MQTLVNALLSTVRKKNVLEAEQGYIIIIKHKHMLSMKSLSQIKRNKNLGKISARFPAAFTNFKVT